MQFKQIVKEHLTVVSALEQQSENIEKLVATVCQQLDLGGKVLFFGNGGSAADSQHMAAEFMVRYHSNRKALPAIALTTDTSILTAHSNDFDFDTVFARQIEALAQPQDVAIGISTSGSSANVLAGLKTATSKHLKTIALTGQSGGEMRDNVDLCISVPSAVTARIQECHILIGHYLCEMIDGHYAPTKEVS
jgi:D-sedoheptulose 7-phosphate isomerase